MIGVTTTQVSATTMTPSASSALRRRFGRAQLKPARAGRCRHRAARTVLRPAISLFQRSNSASREMRAADRDGVDAVGCRQWTSRACASRTIRRSRQCVRDTFRRSRCGLRCLALPASRRRYETGRPRRTRPLPRQKPSARPRRWGDACDDADGVADLRPYKLPRIGQAISDAQKGRRKRDIKNERRHGFSADAAHSPARGRDRAGDVEEIAIAVGAGAEH
jgi:hypothetical protein